MNSWAPESNLTKYSQNDSYIDILQNIGNGLSNLTDVDHDYKKQSNSPTDFDQICVETMHAYGSLELRKIKYTNSQKKIQRNHARCPPWLSLTKIW